MKIKKLLVLGLAALVLTLGAGTATAQNPPLMNGDADSSNADTAVTEMFGFAQLALKFAEAGDDVAAVQLAFDLFVTSYLAFVSIDGYVQGYFSIAIIVGFPEDITGNAEMAAAYLLLVQELASNLASTGNPFAGQITLLAQIATTDLTLALQNSD